MTSAWQQVGAPYLLTGGVAVLPSDLDPVTFPEVDARAGAFKSRAVYEARRLPLELLAIDVADLGPVVAGTPGDPQLPASMLTPSVPPGTPYPVIVSSAFGEGTQAMAVGDQFTLPVEARQMTFRIEEIRDRYPGVDEGVPFVVASRDQLRADRTDGFRTNSAFYIRADDSAETAAAIREQVRASAPFADLAGRVERTDELRTSPIIDAIVLGVALAGLPRRAVRRAGHLGRAGPRRHGPGGGGRPPADDGPDPAGGVRAHRGRTRPDDHHRVRRRPRLRGPAVRGRPAGPRARSARRVVA